MTSAPDLIDPGTLHETALCAFLATTCLQNFAAWPTESSGHHSAAVAVTTAHSASSGASWVSHAKTGSLPIPPEAANEAKCIHQHAHGLSTLNDCVLNDNDGKVRAGSHMSPEQQSAG